MDCHDARQRIEHAPPPGAASSTRAAEAFSSSPDDADLLQHLRQCPDCSAIARTRQAWDNWIALALQQVEVPSAARQRLLARLHLETVAEAAATDAAEYAPKEQPAATSAIMRIDAPDSRTAPVSHRRKWLQRSLLAALLLIGLGTSAWYWRSPALDVASIQAFASQAELDEQSLPLATTGWALPTTMNLAAFTGSTPRFVRIQGQPAVVYFGQVALGRNRFAAARLLVLPGSWLRKPPQATSFLEGPTEYLGNFCATWWVEDRTAYCCLVQGGDEQLRKLVLRRRHA